MKLPDQANSATLADDIAKRRRMLAMNAVGGKLGGTSSPSTTTVLGG